LTRLVDHDAPAVARRAGRDLLDQDIALAPALDDMPPRSLACFARSRRGARLGPRAVAGRTGLGPGDPHELLAAGRDPRQGDHQLDLDVLTPRWTCATTPEEAVEEVLPAEAEIEAGAEDRSEIDAAEEVLGREAGNAREAASVVLGPLLRVGQDGVRLGDLLEPLLGVRLLVTVRVVAQRELAERVLDRLDVGVVGDAQYLIEVAPLSRHAGVLDRFLLLRFGVLRVDDAAARPRPSRPGRTAGRAHVGLRLRTGLATWRGLRDSVLPTSCKTAFRSSASWEASAASFFASASRSARSADSIRWRRSAPSLPPKSASVFSAW